MSSETILCNATTVRSIPRPAVNVNRRSSEIFSLIAIAVACFSVGTAISYVGCSIHNLNHQVSEMQAAVDSLNSRR